jgi:hypothetical protein
MTINKIYFLVISLTLVFSGCKSQSIENVTGMYVNSNFDYEPFIAEIPYLIDTLILNKDYSFRSGYYGEGSFELKENRIKLIYKYEFGSSSYEAPIETDSDGNPKIILFREHNHHYKKIK